MALNNFVKPLLELPSEPVYNQTKEKDLLLYTVILHNSPKLRELCNIVKLMQLERTSLYESDFPTYIVRMLQ